MLELLELLFELVLHLIDGAELLEYWRFFLPFFAGLALSVWIYGRFANHLAGLVFAAPVFIASTVLGVIWEQNGDQ